MATRKDPRTIAKLRQIFLKQHAAAEKAATSVRVGLMTGIATVKQGVSTKALTQAISRGHLGSITNLIPWDDMTGVLAPTMARVAEAGATAAQDEFRALPVAAGLRYDVRNERLQRFINERTGSLITATQEGTLQAVRDATRRSFTEAATPQQVASHIRDSIGLNARHSQALINYRARLSAPESQVAPSRVESMVDAYASRLLNQRAMTIARTEVRMAQNAAQQDVWETAHKEGLLPKSTKRVWVVDGNPCPEICIPMNGIAVDLDEPWVLPDGRRVDNPSEAHPNCFCVSSLTFD